MRSPRMAPPVYGELGSTAITATAWSRDRRSATRPSASVDLPVPGAPVRPTTWGGFTSSPSDSSRCRTDGSPCPPRVIALARPRTFPALNPPTRSRRDVPPLRASLLCDPGPVPVEVGAHDHDEPLGLFARRRYEGRSHSGRRRRRRLDLSAAEEVL